MSFLELNELLLIYFSGISFLILEDGQFFYHSFVLYVLQTLNIIEH